MKEKEQEDSTIIQWQVEYKCERYQLSPFSMN